MKKAYIQTKDKAEHSVEVEEHNETEYATDRMESGTKRAAEETVHQTKKTIKKGADKVKDKVEQKIEDRVKKKVENKAENTAKDTVKNSAERASKNAAKKSAEKPVRATQSAGRKSIRTVEKTSAKTVKQSARSAGKATVKTAKKGTVKTVKTSVKTAEKTSRGGYQDHKASRQNRREISEGGSQSRTTGGKVSGESGKGGYPALIKIIKAIIAALQKLISAIIAGGWVSLLVIMIICMIALICWSVYGLFASVNANEGEYTMHNIITRINNEFNEKITDIKTDNPHDKLVMSGSKAEWKEVLAIYAVAYNMTDLHPANPDEVQVVTLDESKEEYIRNLFWEINKIDHRIEKYTETEQVEEKQEDGSTKKVNKQAEKKTLYITISHVDLETMMNKKGFTDEQKKMCR